MQGLPAEHGFRFFPGFYHGLRNTLGRIPGLNGSVASDLVEVPESALAREKKPLFRFPTRRPQSVGGAANDLQMLFGNPGLGLSAEEAAFAAGKVLEALSTSPRHRAARFDSVAWWDYVEADRMSPAYQAAVADSLTQNFVAMDARMSSTKTVVNILARLFHDYWSGAGIDWILAGPTSELWIDPWVQFLKKPFDGQHPVTFYTNTMATSIVMEGMMVAIIEYRPTRIDLNTTEVHLFTEDGLI